MTIAVIFTAARHKKSPLSLRSNDASFRQTPHLLRCNFAVAINVALSAHAADLLLTHARIYPSPDEPPI
jgi:hypothetical protein